MRLYFSPASPFARKCRIVIREKGISGVEEVRADPLGGDAALNAVNPIGQVPALVDDAGVCWTDSPLICARLDAISGAPRLMPEGEERWGVMRREVIADGVMELGVKIRLELVRPESERSPSWLARWRAGVLRGLDVAEAQAGEEFDLGAIATACALTWLDFRIPDLGWKAGRPKLAALQARLEQRASFRETAPG
ncbi:MAG: glutathione S-transferase N-terminal domain-containing protein [Hyphomonadaceae bacterium]